MQKIEKIELSTNFPIGPVNVYVLFGEKLTLIDTGLNREQAWKELNNGLLQLGLNLKDIEQIVLTHHHNDHTAMIDWILEENPSIQVFAHQDTEMILKDEDYLEWSSQFFEKLFLEFGLTKEMAYKWAYRKGDRDRYDYLNINRTLSDGDCVPGLPNWQVIETLGHSQDHISLYNEKEQLFICGDNIIQGIHAGIFLDAPKRGKERAKPLLQYLDNLEKCRKLNVQLTLSGHGPNIENLNEAIDSQLGNIENRAQRVIRTLEKANGVASGFEIIQEMYRGRYENAVITFVFEIVAVLDLLQKRNVVASEKVNGVYQYRLVNHKTTSSKTI